MLHGTTSMVGCDLLQRTCGRNRGGGFVRRTATWIATSSKKGGYNISPS